MSLAIWFPFSNSTESVGTESVKTTVNGTLAAVDGKLGKCIDFSSGYLSTDFSFDGMSSFTISAWVKLTGSTATGNTIVRHGTKYSPVLDVFSGSFRFFMWSSGSSASTILYAPCTANTWTHVVCTYDGATMRLYTNGTLVSSTEYTGGSYCTGSMEIGQCSALANKFNGHIADLRIYSHVISQKEINELARGMALHFPLNTVSGLDCQPNIATTHLMRAGTTNSAGNSATTRTSSIVYDGSTESGWVLKEVVTAGADETAGLGGFYYVASKSIGSLDKLDEGETYTYSVSLRASKPVKLRGAVAIVESQTFVSSVPPSTATGDIQLTSDWQRYSFTFRWTNTSKFTNCFYVRPGGNGASVTVWIADPKLEKGSVATGFVPNIADSSYDRFSSGEVPDDSGLGHDGEWITDTAVLTTDTPRYLTSTEFDGTNYIYNIEDPISSSSSEFSISFWLNTANSSDAAIWNGRSIVGKASAIFILNGKIAFDDDTRANSRTTVNTGNWFFVTCTWKLGGKKRIYINGALDTETTTTEALTKANTVATIGRLSTNGVAGAYPYIGKLSDFRIYATELSAADIKGMYVTSASMDNLGQLHTGSITEVSDINKVSMRRTGNLVATSFTENLLRYDSRIYVEPDGSMWVRAFHHSAPVGNAFNSSDPFTTGVYGNDSRWFAMSICNHIDKWEIIYEHQSTTESAVSRYRWVQDVNPMTATFADVLPDLVGKYGANDGYSAISSNYGGMYKKGGTTYLCCNNSASSNWFGAVGMSNTSWNGGQIPSYNGVAVSTGYVDVYVRIDNTNLTGLEKEGFSANRTDSSISATGIIEL